MLLQRVITAAIGIPVIVALIGLGGFVYVVAVGIILALAALEFFSATDPEAEQITEQQQGANLVDYALRPVALSAYGAIVLLVIAASEGHDELTGALAFIILAAFLVLTLRGDPATGLAYWIWIMAGISYVGFLGAHLVLLRDVKDGAEWTALAVFSTFAADTCAYFVGGSFGATQIAPRISPGKTLEGSLAGVAGGFAAVIALAQIMGLDADAAEIVLLALLLPLAAIVGDLAESLIKRGAGVKDTSEMVPGHGGFLDRLDSLLFSTPLVYYFVIWVVL